MESLVRLSVPIHGNKPLKIGLLKHLLKTAGLQESDLDLKALFRALQAFKAGGRILCESPVMEDDAIFMRDTFQEMLQ